MTSIRNLHAFLLLTFILFSIPSFSQDYNFDFEIIEDSLPIKWRWKNVKNYKVSLDKDIKQNGNYSIAIESTNKNDLFQPIVYYIPANLKGKKVTLSGYIKTENVTQGWAGLWLRIDPNLGFDNMNIHNKGIKGTTNWKKYEINLELKETDYSTNICFGALLTGNGKIWIDNLELLIDNKPIESIPIKSIPIDELYKSLVEINDSIEIFKNNNSLIKCIKLHEKKIDLYKSKYGLLSPNVLECYSEALSFSKHIKNPEYELQFLSYLAIYYTVVNDYNKGIEIRKDIISKIKQTNLETYPQITQNPDLSFFRLYNYIAKAYMLLKNSTEAENFNELLYKNLPQKTSKDYYFWLREYYITKGNIEFINKNYEDAKVTIEKAYDMDFGLEQRKFHKAYFLGKIAFYQEEYENAITILEPNIEELKMPINVSYLNDYYLYLAKSYKKLNKLNNANKYLELYINIISQNEKFQDTLAKKLKQEEIKQAKLEFENLKTQKEERETYFFYGIIFLSILIVSGLLYIIKNKRRNKQRFKLLIAKLNQKEKTSSPNNNVIKPTKSTIDLTEETTKKILSGLKRLEENQYYLNTDCNTINVSKKIKTNTSYLSRVISYHYQSNFNAYINNLRINYAVSRLKNDTVFRAYSIQSISEEIGYKSPDSFTKYFKKHTGLLPSYYIKQLNSNN